MKKFIAVVLLVAVFATLGLTACGSKNDNTATTTAPQGTSGETKVYRKDRKRRCSYDGYKRRVPAV